MTVDPHDLAVRRQALRLRIYQDERKLAIAYPDQAERIERNLENERAQLAAIDEHVDEAKEQAREQMRAAVEAYFTARDTLLKLNGYFQDPGFTDTIFTRPYLTRGPAMGFGEASEVVVGDPQAPYEVKDVLLRVAQMKPAPDLKVPEHQRRHDESLRNERAGRGYYTDADLQRLAEDPDRFKHGAGFRRVRPQEVLVERDE